MRTIKFRGKRTSDRKWIYGDLKKLEPFGFFIHGYDGEFCLNFGVDTETIGQFTELHDKNGKEIYEGDIVCFDDTPYCVHGNKYQGVVVMHRGAWCVKHYEEWCDEYFYPPLFVDDFASNKTTILGNVYDNPELLKGGKL